MTTTPSQPNREEIDKAYEIGKKIAEDWSTHAYQKSGGAYSPAINEIKDWWIYKFENEIAQALAEQRAEIVNMIESKIHIMATDSDSAMMYGSGWNDSRKDIIARITEGNEK